MSRTGNLGFLLGSLNLFFASPKTSGPRGARLLRRKRRVLLGVVHMPELYYEAIFRLHLEFLYVQANPPRVVADVAHQRVRTAFGG